MRAPLVGMSSLLRAATLFLCKVGATIWFLFTGMASGVEYSYDPLNRLTSVVYSPTQRIDYVYDAAGNLIEERISAPARLSVTAQANPSASGSVGISPAQSSFATGDSVTLTATPINPAWAFSGWSGVPACGAASPCTFTVGTTNVAAVANFVLCTFSVTPAAATYTTAGGSTVITMNTQAGCTWTLTSNASWLTVSGANAGVGTESRTVTAAVNTGAQRSATVDNAFAPGRFIATQDGVATPATCTLITGSGSVPTAGGTQSYTATCSNTTNYVWTLDTVTIASCTTSVCAVPFPANTGTSGVTRVVAVSPSTNASSIYRLPVGQAAPGIAPQCTGAVTGLTSLPATGGTFAYAANCTGATSYTWQLAGVTQAACTGATCNLAFPGNATATAVTRTVNVTATNASGSTPLPALSVAVAAAPATCSFDFTGSGTITPDDALIFTRWLFGIRGESLVSGITPFPAGTSVAVFASNVTSRMTIGLVHDIDNNSKVDPLTDGLLLLRMSLGLTGPSVTSGALGAAATRTDYEVIRTYMNNTCGTSFAAEPSALYDTFDGSALNAAFWTEVRGGTGVATVAGGTVTFGALSSANTQGKVAFSGNKIVVEGRFTGLGFSRDTSISLMDAATGDYLIFGDTSYFSFGFYSTGTGQMAISQVNLAGTTAAYKEYRLTIDGTSVRIERGDTLSSLNELRTAALPTSIVGKTFYLKIATAGPSYSPGTFDWVRVRVY
jgi:YD repeat-containing protein